MTTFITPWGRLWYAGGPQGQVVTGDAFNAWYDMVIRNLPRKTKCVDDVAGWADSLLQLFRDTTEFLTMTGNHGIIQNPDKFVWGVRELEFVGFWVAEDGVKPTAETLQAISEFPRPSDITGVRSWFGLVEQVAFSFSKTRLMEPFRDLLQPKQKFAWSEELQAAFDMAKTEIVRLVVDGVKSFQLGKWLCLVTDWSRRGIGYVLWQKRCHCSEIKPTCCQGGWVTVAVGSRFCTPAESRYAPIEGELLGLTWALRKTGHYTLGCPRLLALVDHKPLIGLLSKGEIGDIDNPRLQSLAEKTMRWNFEIRHVAGVKNFGPDALSRYPGGSSSVHELRGADPESVAWSEELETGVVAAVCSGVRVVTWKAVQNAGITDDEYARLLFQLSSDEGPWDERLQAYQRFKEKLSVVDGVVVFGRRIVVPVALRQEVLNSLHRAHQGSTSMALRASESVWWPGINADLARVRDACGTCIRNAPTQPALPPVRPRIPDYPFQLVASDFFDYAGKSYVVVVDRYSGWPVVSQSKDGTAEELVRLLRTYFCTYGVPEEIATDGALVYVSGTVRKFLETWGVTHRVSSAYNPHSNLRAESGVKSMKRLIAENTGVGGSLNTDRFMAALLTYRNTPDRDTKRSPAQVLFARQLRDTVPCSKENLVLRKDWVLTRDAREEALAVGHQVRGEAWSEKTRPQRPLEMGTVVQVQNQKGPNANKWDLSGVIVEIQPFESYLVKMDGSGRVTKRNRRFLKPIKTFRDLLKPRKLGDSSKSLAEGSGVPAGAQRLREVPIGETGVPAGAQRLTNAQCSRAQPVQVPVPLVQGDHMRSALSEHLLTTETARCGEADFWREQEAETNNAVRTRECDAGRVVPERPAVQPRPLERNIAENISCDVGPESNTGRGDVGNDMDNIPTMSDRRLSTGATESVVCRPKRSVKPIERLVVGNPNAWNFNRAKPRR